MTWHADYDALPLHAKIDGVLSKKNPFPVRCLIWLVMDLDRFNSALIEQIAWHMGYELAPEARLIMGGGMTFSTGPIYVVRPEMVIE